MCSVERYSSVQCPKRAQAGLGWQCGSACRPATTYSRELCTERYTTERSKGEQRGVERYRRERYRTERYRRERYIRERYQREHRGAER